MQILKTWKIREEVEEKLHPHPMLGGMQYDITIVKTATQFIGKLNKITK